MGIIKIAEINAKTQYILGKVKAEETYSTKEQSAITRKNKKLISAFVVKHSFSFVVEYKPFKKIEYDVISLHGSEITMKKFYRQGAVLGIEGLYSTHKLVGKEIESLTEDTLLDFIEAILKDTSYGRYGYGSSVNRHNLLKEVISVRQKLELEKKLSVKTPNSNVEKKVKKV